ncbi:quaternary ammonium compound-resistance protein SugE [Gracilibacillus boraciitolerans JCM 21714]|uniref:Quaternary ammonium compound-resistance protein SugE n=1 Tax=Gracilibacillus boraciitolerans JCM 21714 TaxID=1298598 RepID=W4VJ66_9BACI|nr:SMR family transporter [Gracilibacillus boraciitolerans]GAE93420.1 quaternary ammonium compound-resistance protein SugE [Gracilibacillus boraciitolerans JCM 21714]
MEWIILVVAGLFEMFAVMMMNQWHHTKTKESLLLMIASFAVSFICLAVALETLPMSLAYAIWTGIGAAGGGALIGIMIYNEPKNAKRIFFLSLIIIAVIGLKVLD